METMKGALITGNIKDILEIILITVIIMILLSWAGLSINDVLGFVGTSLTDVYNWFTGLFTFSWF